MLIRAITILLCLSLLPVAQAACTTDLLGGSCDCAATDKCGQECGCDGESAASVPADNAVVQRSLLIAPMAALPPAPLQSLVELDAERSWNGPPTGRAPDRHVPFPQSDLPLLI